MIGSDVRSDAPIHDDEVVRHEPMIDGDPQRRPGWVCAVQSEAVTGIPKPARSQKLGESRRPVPTVEVADDDPGARLPANGVAERVKVRCAPTRLKQRVGRVDEP